MLSMGVFDYAKLSYVWDAYAFLSTMLCHEIEYSLRGSSLCVWLGVLPHHT